MIATIRVEVDPSLLVAHVEKVNREHREEDPAAVDETPAEFLRRRLEELCDDELEIALWDWTRSLGMRTSVAVDNPPTGVSHG